jgi:hypothetical protein
MTNEQDEKIELTSQQQNPSRAPRGLRDQHSRCDSESHSAIPRPAWRK